QICVLFFMVTFPAVIESGSEAKLCASLLRPNETLQMTIYLIHNNHSRTLVEETVEEEFHRCSQFKAPEVDGQSLQEIKVQVKGESFEMTEKSRVLFKSYNTLTFIQTDKPIYNPGQTEIFELKATVFNYLPKCIMVKVTPAPSTHYTLKASSDGQYSSCLCASGRKTFKWTLTPSVLGVMNVTVSAEAEQSQTVCDNEIVSVPERGRIDTVTRSLIVQAEGTEKTKCQSWLLCPQGSSVSEELELTLPEDVVEGSARASVSVLGDILGLALKNIDGLLRMPYGCGEQNIALLSPNIYILQYLENTGQLTAAIRERATEFLKSGYQRQLNYKHYSGAYSTFGTGHGNTWLTAFVLRTFGQAQRYIFIDPQNINSAKQWLIGKQRPDGCFLKKGRLFNNRMKGGVNDHITMTAYITASMLELGNTDPAVSGGLRCLKSTIGNLTNTYTTALLAYAFSLAGENDTRNQLLKELESVSISGDGRLHWSQSASGDSDSLAVEISSYVLLAVLTTDQLSTADLGYANRIVSWLVRQQNPYGGFSSTQDTVVALQALALYSTKVFSSDGSSTVTVQSAGGDSHQFDVHQNNKLLYQEKPLQDVSGKYSIEVKGSTCVSVQMALFYNIPTPAETSTLGVKAKTEGNCTKSFGRMLSLVTSFVPSRYNGALSSTNMVIVDIKLLSGFTALKYRPLVERVDAKDDHVIMYIKEVPRNVSMNYELHIEQVLQVKNLKPAVIKVYDYYQTSDQSETEYSYPCA
uniref:Alpha-macroglobulin receptor-binding domain-containing protein n=1 Tax=Electrophorus electricus TaxID=8005 RepID=A0A4W4DR10_ELEEL